MSDTSSGRDKPVARRAVPLELADELLQTLEEMGLEKTRVATALALGEVTTDDLAHAKALRVDADHAARRLSQLFTPPPEPGSVRPLDRDREGDVAWHGANWLCSTGWSYEQGVGWRRPDGTLASGPGDVWSALEDALSSASLARFLDAAEDEASAEDVRPEEATPAALAAAMNRADRYGNALRLLSLRHPEVKGVVLSVLSGGDPWREAKTRAAAAPASAGGACSNCRAGMHHSCPPGCGCDAPGCAGAR